MANNNKVHKYEGCVSTGPQHLNPDPEILTVGQKAQQQYPNVLPAQALLMWAFALELTDQMETQLIRK